MRKIIITVILSVIGTALVWSLTGFYSDSTQVNFPTDTTSEYFNKTTSMEISKPSHYIVAGNYYVNETIRNLENNGWKVIGVKAISAPSGTFGCYDLLITYE